MKRVMVIGLRGYCTKDECQTCLFTLGFTEALLFRVQFRPVLNIKLDTLIPGRCNGRGFTLHCFTLYCTCTFLYLNKINQSIRGGGGGGGGLSYSL